MNSDAARDAAINIRIVQPTTPAQYFHVLRRQIALRCVVVGLFGFCYL